MRRMLLAIVPALVIAGPAAASDHDDVIAAVNRFVDAFNKGDTKAIEASCAPETSIIDEFPPHEWHGAGGCLKWAADFDVAAKKEGITDAVVTLRKPRHVDVSGDRAYVVVPADYDYKQKGKPVHQDGSMFTLVLQKMTGAWRVTAWSWSTA